MSAADLPHILIVDDEDTSHIHGFDDLAKAKARHPNDVEAQDLDWANLVLMDFKIEHWGERDELDQISLQPSNGLALAAVLREYADSQPGQDGAYTAFAIHSGHVGEISQRLHTTNKAAHVVARLNNLEWVFDKAEDSRFQRSAQLAKAIRMISGRWEEVERQGTESAAKSLLQLPSGLPWSSRAIDEIILNQIPLSEFSAGTNGLQFLRWMLHAVLPYPTFLWAEQWVAARLGITLGSLRKVLGGESELARGLEQCKYCGILESFLEERWWQAGVEQYAWEIRSSGARDPEKFHQELESRAGSGLERLDFSSPVVCINKDLAPSDELCDLEEAVRIVPDLWPAYAGTAYATISSVEDDPDLAAVVHPLDRDRIDKGSRSDSEG